MSAPVDAGAHRLGPPLSPRWYALAVHVRSETVAASELATVVDDVFLPIRVERRAWSDRIKRVELPLFPGYLFVRTAMSAAHRVSILRIKHAVELVGRVPGAAVALPVDDGELEALRIVTRAERELDPIARLVPGRLVEVAQGPLRGAQGIVEVSPDGQRRLVVQIALLGRGVRTVLSADDVILSGTAAA